MKNSLLTLFVLLGSIGVFAQTPFSFNNFGSTGDDCSYAVCKDDNGGYYTSGFFKGSMTMGSTVLTSAGAEDMYVAKHDATGQVVWAKKAGGAGSDMGYSISYSEGFVYVTGIYSATATFGTQLLSSSGSTDGYIAKYDVNGNFIWAKKVGSTLSDRTDQIVFAPGGIMYMQASIGSGCMYNSVSLTNNGNVDAYLFKMDTAGALIDHVNIGGTSNDYAFDLKLEGSNLYITGDFASDFIDFGTTFLGNHGNYDVYLAKYDLLLNEVWGVVVGGSSVDHVEKTIIDLNGNCYLTGSFAGSAMFGTQTVTSLSGGKDGFLAKYNSNGILEWVSKMGGTSLTCGRDMLFSDDQKNISVVGHFQTQIANATKTVSSTGDYDAFLVQYDSSGIASNLVTFGGTGSDIPNEMVGLNNDIWVLGSMTETTSFNSMSYTSNGGSDIAVWQLKSSSVGVEEEIASVDFEMYPNPTQRVFVIKSKNAIQSLEVYDLLGNKVYATSMNDTDVSVALQLSKGMYFVVVDGNNQSARKLIIE